MKAKNTRNMNVQQSSALMSSLDFSLIQPLDVYGPSYSLCTVYLFVFSYI